MIIKFLKENRNSLIYLLLLVLVPLLFTSGVIVFFIEKEALFKSMRINGWLIFYLLSVFTMAFSLTPTTFIALSGGFFLGWEAVWFVIPSYLIASAIGYGTAGLIDKGKLLRSLSETEKVQHFIQKLDKRQFMLIFLSRLSPALPFALMNFVLSALRTNFPTFLLAGFWGMLPRTVLSIWIGLKAKQISQLTNNPNEGIWGQLLLITLVAASILGILYIIGKAMQKNNSEEIKV